jgi:hypothetical protein
MEQEPAEFYERVRQGYRQLAAREPKRIVLIDASRSAGDIDAEIWERLATRFPRLKSGPKSEPAKASARGVQRSRMDRKEGD